MKERERIAGGRYRLISVLGLGGFGEVYLAEGPQGLVAIKVVDTAGWSQREYKVFNALLVNEASFLSTLSHPALPKLRELFAEATRYFLVMDWVSGQTLEEAVLCHGPFSFEEAFRLLDQLLSALEYLHNECSPSVIFGDLKPANILRTQDGQFRLVDLGLVTREGSSLTGDFAVYSPPFSAPERAQGQPSSKRHDVFSLAATVLFVLTARRPGVEQTQAILRTRLAKEPFPEMARHRAEQLLMVLLACFESDPAARPPNLRALRSSWRRWSDISSSQVESKGEILKGLYKKQSD